MKTEIAYGYMKRLPGRTMQDARAQVTEALKSQGFGILTEIDVRDTLKKKIGADFRPYLILGACNPNLAQRALTTELPIGLLLPCNVCLWQDDDGVTVGIQRPDAMFQVVQNPQLVEVANEADRRLRAVLAELR